MKGIGLPTPAKHIDFTERPHLSLSRPTARGNDVDGLHSRSSAPSPSGLPASHTEAADARGSPSQQDQGCNPVALACGSQGKFYRSY